jgi:hypothetical protein
MKSFIKNYWKTIAFFVVIGLMGGFFTGLYLLDSYPAEIRQQFLNEVSAQGLDFMPIDMMMGVVAASQAAGYGLVLGVVGILLSKKIGLWKDEKTFAKKPLIAAGVVSVIGGLALILLDIFFFGKYSQTIMDSYATKPTVVFLVASVLYGGVIEEVMLRLFMMSLVAWILHKLFGKKSEQPSPGILIAANVVSAALFAAGHLPATYGLMGLTPMIVLRCFLLNGGIGLLFGWLYRKYGLRYAMIAHAGCHVISKLIWILFI